jgi:hypothetical protein
MNRRKFLAVATISAVSPPLVAIPVMAAAPDPALPLAEEWLRLDAMEPYTDEVSDLADAVCKRLLQTQAVSAAGIRAKLRVLMCWHDLSIAANVGDGDDLGDDMIISLMADAERMVSISAIC